MALTLTEKKHVGYVNIANAVASESAATPLHDKRLIVCRQYASGGGQFDWYVTQDFAAQAYDDTTIQATVDNRLSALLTVLVNLWL